MNIAIYDIEKKNQHHLYPFSVNHASFEIKVGLYTNFERIKKVCRQEKININKIYLFVREDLSELIQERYPDCIVNPEDNPNIDLKFKGNSVVINIDERDNNIIMHLWDIFDYNEFLLKNDFSNSDNYKHSNLCKIHDSSIQVNKDNIFIGERSNIKAGSILESQMKKNECIVIGKNVTIDVGSIIQGNVFIDDNSYIAPGAKIRSGTFIGKNCKIGGEVSYSIVGDYSNKVHDGFLGHSFVGEWVNIGAGTNISNLKNNYSNIKYSYNDSDFINTDRQFLGSFIGDYSKLGISTMLNTGTHIGLGSNIFGGGFQKKYSTLFSWGKEEIVDFDRFITTCSIMKKRRGREMSKIEIQFLKKIYNKIS